ncbi:dual specificity protein phosphatase family protein [Maribacter sp. ANRC-HE7]|uniref:Dual specificity protein phosphatase family protein n=1 Tax=Maribacter aquimaris TaxID=2737171 RepID=A0ABR7V3N4_9FLAO|nr:dual specificity protein phosphatase family protein [Maribacter aquimaris]MBD0777921.1 dual specificity protein phosphatase family protein [Maribacter aquimaris]
MNKKWVVFIFIGLSVLSYAQESDAQKIDSRNFKNLYRLNDSLYRSEQPSKKGFKYLESLDVKTVLNLRRSDKNGRKADGTSLQLVNLPLKAGKLTEDQIILALKAIQGAEGPVLVHCWHGSDRTGAIIAAYRIVFENWTKEKAIAELRNKFFGYHEKMYPNVVTLLQNLNIGRIKKDLGI